MTRVGLELAQQDPFRLVGGHPGHPLELALLLFGQRVIPRRLLRDGRLSLGDGPLAGQKLRVGAFGRRCPVGDGVGLLGELLLERGQLLAARAGLLLRLVQEVVRLLLGGQHDFLALRLRVPFGILEESPRRVLGSPDGVGGDALAAGQPDGEQHRHGDDGADVWEKSVEAHARSLSRDRGGYRPWVGPLDDGDAEGRRRNPALPCGEVE